MGAVRTLAESVEKTMQAKVRTLASTVQGRGGQAEGSTFSASSPGLVIGRGHDVAREAVPEAQAAGAHKNSAKLKRLVSDVSDVTEDDAAADAHAAKRPKQITSSAVFSAVQRFFFLKAELRSLSNFALIPVTLDGRNYATGEHCFHAHKYLHAASQSASAARAAELRAYAARFQTGRCTAIGTNGIDAKRAGGKKGMALSDLEMRTWLPTGEAMQLRICRDKVARCAEVRADLLKTGDALLLHQDNRAKPDTPWGGKIPNLKEKLSQAQPIKYPDDVIGQNRLGQIWMKVREEVRPHKADH